MLGYPAAVQKSAGLHFQQRAAVVRLTLKLKLAGTFGILAVALFGIAIFSISQLQAYNAQVAQIADVYTPAQGYLLNADRDSQQALVAERSLLLLSPTSEEFEAQRQEHADNITQITERMESYATLIDADWSNALMEQFWPQFDAWKEASLGLIKETGQNRTGNRPVIPARA